MSQEGRREIRAERYIENIINVMKSDKKTSQVSKNRKCLRASWDNPIFKCQRQQKHSDLSC
jgi:hypothetical protein